MQVKNIKEQPHIVIHKIGAQHVMSDEDFKYLQGHLNVPLPLVGTWYYSETGELSHLTIVYGEGVITLFDANDVEATLVYPIDEERKFFMEHTMCRIDHAPYEASSPKGFVTKIETSCKLCGPCGNY